MPGQTGSADITSWRLATEKTVCTECLQVRMKYFYPSSGEDGSSLTCAERSASPDSKCW